MFPPEVVENILLHCDGKTLMNAQHVDTVWKGCVDYLSNETDLWKRCCHNDIPKYELMQILTKHEKKVTVKMWRMIFYNWSYWQNISDNIDFEVEFFVITRTLCMNVFGEYISVGFENGFVHIYKADDMLRSFKSFRLMHLPVSSTAIIGEDDNSEPCQLLMNYNTSLFVTDFNRKTYQPGALENCYKFGHYMKYVCCITEYGKVTIATVKTDHIHEKLNFFPLTQVRIYSPAIVTDCFLTEYMCTILVNNKIQIIKYSQNSVQSSVIAVDQATLRFSCMEDANWQRVRCTTKFVSSQVLINLAKISDTSVLSEMFELYIIDSTSEYKKKIFNSWEIFKDSISCMFLYGNTFLVGTNCGDLYFYEISDWKLFNLAKYSHVEHVSKMYPILSIDVCDNIKKRTYYCLTIGGIYRVICYCIPQIKEDHSTW